MTTGRQLRILPFRPRCDGARGHAVIEMTRYTRVAPRKALPAYADAARRSHGWVGASGCARAYYHPVEVGLMQGSVRSDPRLARMDEDQVIALAKEGSGPATEYLLRKYEGLVEAKAKSYFLMGAEREDVIQEGMIGLFKAIRDFTAHKFGGFRKFAALCVTRQIISAVKCASRQKHSALNSYVSMDAAPSDSEDEGMLQEVLAAQGDGNPESMVVGRELQRRVSTEMDRSLSELERDVLREYMRGHSYREIADGLGTNVKQVDNALQRAKKKLEEHVPVAPGRD